MIIIYYIILKSVPYNNIEQFIPFRWILPLHLDTKCLNIIN